MARRFGGGLGEDDLTFDLNVFGVATSVKSDRCGSISRAFGECVDVSGGADLVDNKVVVEK